jgi:L-seryl-tRNA(Ser) seleniumtransferase
VWQMISQSEETLKKRARKWVRNLKGLGVTAQVVPGRSAVGGGSLPGEDLPTHLVALAVESPDAKAARLRAGEPPVITRIEDDRLVLDPRTVMPEQEAPLWQLVTEAIR